jgi:hypothetical protein
VIGVGRVTRAAYHGPERAIHNRVTVRATPCQKLLRHDFDWCGCGCRRGLGRLEDYAGLQNFAARAKLALDDHE